MPPTKAHSIAHTTGLTRRPCDTALVWSVDYISPVINSPIFSSLHSTHKQFFFSFFFKPVIRQEARLLSSTLVTCLTSQHSSACRNIRLPVRPHRNNQRYGSAPERSRGGHHGLLYLQWASRGQVSREEEAGKAMGHLSKCSRLSEGLPGESRASERREPLRVAGELQN